MLNSVNTNTAGLLALQALNTANREVSDAQRVVATGKAVGSAKDNGAIWSIARMMNSEVGGLGVVADSLNRAASITDIAAQGTANVNDLLGLVHEKALAYQDNSLNGSARAALKQDIQSLLDKIDRAGRASTFDGINLINSPGVDKPTDRYNVTSYTAPPSPLTPQSFTTPMQSLSSDTTVSRTLQTTKTYSLPYSPLTPGGFTTVMNATAGNTGRAYDQGLHAGTSTGILLDPTGTTTSPSRVDLALDAFTDPASFEIWQNGVRLAATGQPQALGGAAVGAAGPPATGQSLLSFDYDPDKGPVELRATTAAPGTTWAVDFLRRHAGATAVSSPPTAHTTILTSSPDPSRPAEPLHPETSGAPPAASSQTFAVDAGTNAGRVSMVFDAFDDADVVEVWQNGVRLAATGQAYAPGGGAVGAGTAVSGPSMLTFDYDPAAGQTLEFRINDGVAATGSSWSVGGIVLQAASAPVPGLSISTSTIQQVQTQNVEPTYTYGQAPPPPLDPELTVPVHALPTTYSLDAGDVPGRVDMLFDAFGDADTVEIWQGSTRLAASGRAYAAGGAAVGAALAVSNANLISFDYDPTLGQALEFRFNTGRPDSDSAWLVGGMTLNPLGSAVPSTASWTSDATYTNYQTVYPEYDFITSTAGDTLRLDSRNLSLIGLGLNAIDWDNPAALLAKTKAAEVTVREAATHFGERQNLLDSLLSQTTRNRDAVSGGVGNLVDADMAKASAQLQAAQARQGLAGQVLAIANAAPQWIMGLFKT